MINALLKDGDFETKFVHVRENFYKTINEFKPDMVLFTDNVPNLADHIRDNYVNLEDKPKGILLTNERYSEREKRILLYELNIMNCINTDSIVEQFQTKLKDNL